MNIIFIFTLFFTFICNSFAEDEAKKSSEVLTEGNITVYGAYERSDFDDKTNLSSEEEQQKPFAGVSGLFSYKNLDIFGKNNDNKFGFNVEFSLDSEELENPIQLREAGILITTQDYGVRMLGLQKPVTSKLKVNSSTISGASEGIAGRWQHFIKYPFSNTQNGQSNASFITKPFLPIEHGFASVTILSNSEQNTILQPFVGWGENNIGVSYVSGRINGFKVGASYFPDNKSQIVFRESQKDIRGFDLLVRESTSYLKNIFALGGNFYNEFNGLELSVSANYEHASTVSKLFERRDLNAFSVGFNVSYVGLMIGGSFVNYGKSFYIKNNISTGLADLIIGNNSYYEMDGSLAKAGSSYSYDIGIGYSIGRYNINLAYLNSEYVENKFWSLTSSFEVKMDKNLISYIQLARYQFTSSNQINEPSAKGKSAGGIFLVGVQYQM